MPCRRRPVPRLLLHPLLGQVIGDRWRPRVWLHPLLACLLPFFAAQRLRWRLPDQRIDRKDGRLRRALAAELQPWPTPQWKCSQVGTLYFTGESRFHRPFTGCQVPEPRGSEYKGLHGPIHGASRNGEDDESGFEQSGSQATWFSSRGSSGEQEPESCITGSGWIVEFQGGVLGLESWQEPRSGSWCQTSGWGELEEEKGSSKRKGMVATKMHDFTKFSTLLQAGYGIYFPAGSWCRGWFGHEEG